MARPAWTNIADTTIDQDSLGKETDVFTALRNNARAARIELFGVDIAADSHTGDTNWTDVVGSTFEATVPSLADYTGIQRRVQLVVKAKVTGAITGEWRLVDVTNATNGATKTTASASDVNLDLEVDAVAGTATYKVQFRTPAAGSTVHCSAADHYTGRVEF